MCTDSVAGAEFTGFCNRDGVITSRPDIIIVVVVVLVVTTLLIIITVHEKELPASLQLQLQIQSWMDPIHVHSAMVPYSLYKLGSRAKYLITK